MRLSLRSLLLTVFAILILSACLQGVLAIATTAQSARQLTVLEQRSLVPSVGLGILSQNLDQERALVAVDVGHMKPDQAGAVFDELKGLDRSIDGEVARQLRPALRGAWSVAWAAYRADRAAYMGAMVRRAAGPAVEALRLRLSDRLSRVMDVVQSDEGQQLYAGENLYTRALADDWHAIQMAVAGLVVALSIGIAVAILIVRRLSTGLGNLSATARSITSGALQARAHDEGHDEIALLATAFNHMTDALLSAERRADNDALTGLLNHRAFHDCLSNEAARAETAGTPLCVVMIDLTNFKMFNDTYGHPVGDRVLTTFADLLRRECRPGDRIARYGGDEFAVLAAEATIEGGRALAERILRSCAEADIRVGANTAPLPIGLSVGVAAFPVEARTPVVLVELAQRRMAEAKHAGGGLCAAVAVPTTTYVEPNAPFSVLDGLITSIDNKDQYTRVHSEWVARFADVLAQALDFGDEARQRLRRAALVHDVGKIGTPDHILRKPGRLNDDEYAIMKQHVVLSELIVAQVAPSSDILDAVRYHHERWDGKGYPYGLSGTAVPLEGRIMIIADASSAMYLDRPYRKGVSREALIEELRRNRGTQFDPALADLFIAALDTPSSPILAPSASATATGSGSSAAR